MAKNLLTLKDYSGNWIKNLIDKAIVIKANKEKYSSVLKNKTLAMLFEKTSTRTRCSFEAGMTQLGGHAMFLDWKTTQLGKAKLEDEILCIERYSDIIMARVYEQKTLEKMAKVLKKPLINALSDLYHPCQILSDLMTIKEKKKELKGLKLAYVGDGNNVCNSLIIGCSKVGMKISVATPKVYEPSKEAVKIGKKALTLTSDPKGAVKDADIVYTDTWISMGQEAEKEKRLKIFPLYQVNKRLMKNAKKDALFMHCLPAYRGLEVANSVMDSKQSVVFDQAENRMHCQNGIILKLLNRL